MDDVLKKIEALEKRVKELESKQKPSQQMFGRSYSQAGDINSDFLIKTKGQIKVQWGNKFIDLIKDGIVNCDAKFVYKQNQVGTKDGIYVADNGEVTIVVRGEQINLKGEIGNTYVSFLALQDTTPNQKHTAQVNIGLVAETQNDVNITSGIVYVESESKLYIVNNGTLQEFKLDFPNPFPEQFIIAKNDSKLGSLLIQGSGKENSMAFNGLYIYTDDNSIIESDKEFNIIVEGQEIVRMSPSHTLFNYDVVSKMFKSPGATLTSGFRLYYQNGQSTLEVDNLIWRNKPEDLNTIGEYWFSVANIISDVNLNEDENDEGTYTKFTITLTQPNIFKENDILLSFLQNETTIITDEGTDDEDEYSVIELTPIYFTVISSSDNQIDVISNSSISKDSIKDIIQKVIYRVNPESPIRIKDNNLDVLGLDNDLTMTSKLRIGDINKEIIDNNKPSKKDQIKGSGIYSDIGLFKEAAYTSNYRLEDTDNSSRLASTEWVKKLVAGIKIPDKVSELENDVPYLTIEDLPENDKNQPIILFSGILTSNNNDNNLKYQPFKIDVANCTQFEGVSKLDIEYVSSTNPGLKITVVPKVGYTIKPTSSTASILAATDNSNGNHFSVLSFTGGEKRSAGYWTVGGTEGGISYWYAGRTGNEHQDATNFDVMASRVTKLNITIYGIGYKM